MQTIYILDYDSDIVYALCEWLKLYGFTTKGFTTLEQLFHQLAGCKPDCIVLDCLYGRVSLTAEICHTLQQVFHYDGKIILTSTNTLSAKDLQACGVAHFVAKPFDILQLLDTINDVFDHTSTPNNLFNH